MAIELSALQIQTLEKKLRRPYWYTLCTALPLGLLIMLKPGKVLPRHADQTTAEQGFIYMLGGVFAAFGVLSLLGLRSPRKWQPILLLQMLYKIFAIVAGMYVMKREGTWVWDKDRTQFVFGNATYVVLDLLSMNFRDLLRK